MTPESNPSAEERRAALAEVLQSLTFARAEQLRAFLRYVCEMELDGRADRLTEYAIGVDALGRPREFSPLEDSSVRTRAYELRQRLLKYYAGENPNAGLRIELPKGSYVPRFVSVKPSGPPPIQEAVPLDVEPVDEVTKPRPRMPGWAVGFVAGLLLAGAIMWTASLWRVQSSIEPSLRKSWAPILTADREVLISLAAPLHLQVTPYLAFTPTGTPSYPAPQELYALFSRYRDLPENATLRMMPVQKTANMGNIEGLVQTVKLLDRFGADYRVLTETIAPLKALREHSAFLFGSPWYSRVAAVLLEQTPWTLQMDEETKEVGLFGRGSQAGKKFLPVFGPNRGYREVFGLLSVLPNDQGPGGKHTIVVFSGLTSVGSHGAAAFFTSAKSMADLGERFRKEGLSTWPRSYQVVVRCRASEDTQLLSYSYETHQVLAR